MKFVLRTVFIMFIFTLTLYGVQKDENYLKISEILIKIEIKDINSFNFDSLKKKYQLNLKFCIGESICIFKLTNNSLNEGLLEDIAPFGKVQIYRPYRLKIY